MNINIAELLRIVWPLIVLQLVLTVTALVDMARREKVKYLPKAAWAIISIFVATIGPIAYFALGRGEE